MLALLRERFGLESFLPGQREAIEALLEHRRELVTEAVRSGERVVRALEVLEQRGLGVLEASDVLHLCERLLTGSSRCSTGVS